MQIITGTANELSAGMLFDLAHYRYRVFVQKLGWKLQTRGRMELDQFDRRDTGYLIALNDEREIIGTARLLPTQRPYLLADVFPMLLASTPPPRTPKVWELSRFTAVDLRGQEARNQRPFGSDVALDLLAAAMRMAADSGAERLISASPLGIERVLRNAGVSAHRFAPPVVIDGKALFACYIDIDRAWRPPKDRRPERGVLSNGCGWI